MLLTGPFGGLTDDVREFLLCLADEGLPLTGWGDLDPASLRIVRERLPGGGALGDGPDGLALARRRTTLLRSLCDAGRLAEERDGALQLTALGREFLDLPAAAQLGFVFAAWWEGVDWGLWAPTAELGRLLWHQAGVTALRRPADVPLAVPGGGCQAGDGPSALPAGPLCHTPCVASRPTRTEGSGNPQQGVARTDPMRWSRAEAGRTLPRMRCHVLRRRHCSLSAETTSR